MKRKVLSLLLFASFLVGAGPSLTGTYTGRADIASAQEDWRREYEDVCSRTQDAMTLSESELTDLIARCDALKPVIEKLEETQKKVYLKRLRMCRDLLSFVLESKKK